MSDDRGETVSILVVEDDPEQLRLYAKVLRSYRLTCVSSATAAITAIESKVPDLIILDHVLADGEKGTELIPEMKHRAAHVPIIVISGTLDIDEQLRVAQGPLSAHYVLRKPVSVEAFEETVDKALSECGIGETVAMLRSLEQTERIEHNEPERRFTERLNRQHEILNRYRSAGKRPNVSALAREFNVVRKTIQRDLHDLVKRGQLPRDLFPDWESDEKD